MIDDPQSDYYSSNDTSSDSEDALLVMHPMNKEGHPWRKQSLWHA